MNNELNAEDYNETVEAINTTFSYFFPGEPKPEISAVALHFATVVMHEAVSASIKYSVAVGVMKQIPNLNPSNAVSWLAKLPWAIVKQLYQNHGDVYKAVRDVLQNKFRVPYQDLVDGRKEYVTPVLAKYNSLLGTSY